MRILVVTSGQPGTYTETLTTELAERLRLRGHRVALMVPGAAVLLAARQVDLVVPIDAPLGIPWLARWLWGRPYVPVLSQVAVHGRRKVPFLSWLRLATHWNARRTLTLNAAARNGLVRLGVPRSKLELAAPPVELSAELAPSTPVPPRVAVALADRAPLSASAIYRIFDHVLEDFPSAQLGLTGPPDAVAAAEERVARLGLEAQVQFFEDARALLARGGIALAISAKGEPCNAGFVLAAAAAGLPVVAMRNELLDDWLKDGVTATLTAAGDEHAAAAAIRHQLQHPAEAAERAAAARERIGTRHRWDDFLDLLLGESTD